MLGLRSSSPMPSAWVASPPWEAITNTTTTATGEDGPDHGLASTEQHWFYFNYSKMQLLVQPHSTIIVGFYIFICLTGIKPFVKQTRLLISTLSVLFPGIASPFVSWTVVPVLLQDLPSSPSWDLCPTSRTCPSQKWQNLVGFSTYCWFLSIHSSLNVLTLFFGNWHCIIKKDSFKYYKLYLLCIWVDLLLLLNCVFYWRHLHITWSSKCHCYLLCLSFTIMKICIYASMHFILKL